MTESIEWFIENQASTPRYNLAPSPLSRQQVVSLSQSSCVRRLLRRERGIGGGDKSYDVEKAWSPVNHSILSGQWASREPYRFIHSFSQFKSLQELNSHTELVYFANYFPKLCFTQIKLFLLKITLGCVSFPWAWTSGLSLTNSKYNFYRRIARQNRHMSILTTYLPKVSRLHETRVADLD